MHNTSSQYYQMNQHSAHSHEIFFPHWEMVNFPPNLQYHKFSLHSEKLHLLLPQPYSLILLSKHTWKLGITIWSHKWFTYNVKSLSSKLSSVFPLSLNTSVVVSLLESQLLPPIKIVPYWEEDQAEWATRSWLRSCECVHFPLEKVTHEYEVVILGDPPQAISPDWVWKYLSSGRSGKLHQWVPSFESNSTDLCPLKSDPYPPETIIAEKDIISVGCCLLI